MKNVLQIVIAIITAGSGAGNAFGCSCPPFEIKNSFNEATYVFEAYITEAKIIYRKEEEIDVEKGEFVLGRFNLGRNWKGNAEKIDGVITRSKSNSCGVPLTPGRNYVFFVSKVWVEDSFLNNSHYGRISICSNPQILDYEEHLNVMNWLKNNEK